MHGCRCGLVPLMGILMANNIQIEVEARVKDRNVRPQTIKILEENIGCKISDTAYRNILSDISPQARKTKEKINKCDYIKLKVFSQKRKPSTK